MTGVQTCALPIFGWNETTQNGSFTGDFTNQTKGQTLTQTFISEGADIIFPVAGGAGLGAGAAAQASGGKANVIWVDTDGCESAAQYCDFFITSVTKNLSGSVQQYVSQAAKGTFPTGSYVGTLDNDGTGLAPFHNFDSQVPSALKSELQQVSTGIQNGSIKVATKSPA